MRPDLMLLVPFIYLVFHLFDAERDRPKPDLSRNFAIPMGPQVGKHGEPYCPYCTDGINPEDSNELCGLTGCDPRFVNPAHVTPTGPGTWVAGITGDPDDECDCACCTGPEAA